MSCRDIPSHLFVSDSDGGLYDTRSPEWSKTPLRTNYSRHFTEIDSVARIKASLREGEFAFPGGYRLAFLTSDGAVLSFDAVRDEFASVIHSIRHNISDGWKVVGLINVDEIEDLIYCDHTNECLNRDDNE